ncbi:hypothetical protein BDK51DRAFT_39357 [Blyttiomyces helicus]|uniref:Uncharacterized protein n=1 Tax=Blyttiomyces helicus TaxID=388810 RepID=A0A4P9VY98_9FUNG|nr:hypothetical protein BDK51DRAFT_39357 [Blyttiomyces helicus]|eukprot:RKO83723.1 hypothetical protein BDK51DRAFT_39357 [Blyttiomyces helicus]
MHTLPCSHTSPQLNPSPFPHLEDPFSCIRADTSAGTPVVIPIPLSPPYGLPACAVLNTADPAVVAIGDATGVVDGGGVAVPRLL